MDTSGDDSGSALAERFEQIRSERRSSKPRRPKPASKPAWKPAAGTADLQEPQEARPVVRQPSLVNDRGYVCADVRTQLVWMTGARKGERHAMLLGPLLQLVRLGREGHRGLTVALEQFETWFLGEVSQHRTDGLEEARLEWQKAYDHAMKEVTARRRNHLVCDC